VATAAAERFRSEQHLVEKWLITMGNLTAFLGASEPCPTPTCIPAVLTAMTHLPTLMQAHDKSLVLASHVLRLFGAFNPLLVRLDRGKLAVAVPPVVTALRLLKSDAAAVMPALLTLARIVESSQDLEPSLAAAATVGELMTIHMGDANLVNTGVVFLGILAGEVPAREQGRVVAQTRVVRAAQARYPRNGPIQEWANKFLFRTKQV
jgi:hypothetical protein